METILYVIQLDDLFLVDYGTDEAIRAKLQAIPATLWGAETLPQPKAELFLKDFHKECKLFQMRRGWYQDTKTVRLHLGRLRRALRLKLHQEDITKKAIPTDLISQGGALVCLSAACDTAPFRVLYDQTEPVVSHGCPFCIPMMSPVDLTISARHAALFIKTDEISVFHR